MRNIYHLSGLVFLFVWFVGFAAYADCGLPPDAIVETAIHKIHAPVYDGPGNTVKGCILETADGKVMGFADDQKLCTASPDQKIKVRIAHGCCDTGPDAGDVECVVRSKWFMGLFEDVHGNGKYIHPTEDTEPTAANPNP